MWHSWVGDRHDGEQIVKSFEVFWVGGEQGEVFGDRGGGDHEVDHPTSWFASAGDHHSGYGGSRKVLGHRVSAL